MASVRMYRPSGSYLGWYTVAIGLWVGGGVSPNHLEGGKIPDADQVFHWFPGAIELLRGDQAPRNARRSMQSTEPAQVLECPACRTVLAVAHAGLPPGDHVLHFVFQSVQGIGAPSAAALSRQPFVVSTMPRLHPHPQVTYYTLTVMFSTAGARVEEVDMWWREVIAPALGSARPAELEAVRASRPGYFLRSYPGNQQPHPFDFDICCPNPECALNQVPWTEKVPVPMDATEVPDTDRSLQQVILAFQIPGSAGRRATHTPIPAYTVDEQVYRRCPSMIVGTVDKFARLAYEDEAATMFGDLEWYHARSGYYRAGAPPGDSGVVRGHPSRYSQLSVQVAPFDRPQLIIRTSSI